MKRTVALIASIALAGTTLSVEAQVPKGQELKAAKEAIIEHIEQDGEVLYAYKNGNRVSDAIPQEVEKAVRKGEKIVREELDRRGSNVRVFGTDSGTTIYEFVAGAPQYYKEPGGNWVEIDYATTSKDAFEKQTKTVPERIFGSFIDEVRAQTFYPSLDGEVSRNGSVESWATIRGGTANSTSTADTLQYAPFVNADTVLDTYSLYQIGLFRFDTSSISDSEVATAATMSVVTQAEFTTAGDLNVNISSATISGPLLEFSDYANTIATYSTTFSTDKAISAFTSDDATYNDFAFNASGLAAISVTGNSDFAMRFSIDIANSGTPTWALAGQTGLTMRMSEQTGTSKDPKLVVTTGPAPVAAPPEDNVFILE